MDNQGIRKSINVFCDIYEDDVDLYELTNEVLHFKANINVSYIHGEYNLLDLQTFLYEKNLTDIYPNIEIILQIFTSMAVTNCSVKRSFSYLNRVINFSHSTMTQDRMNSLAILKRMYYCGYTMYFRY